MAVGITQAADLDRAALIKLADDYFAALIAHTPNKVPLDGNVKMVENAKRIKPGEGLWKTAAAAQTEFKINISDREASSMKGAVAPIDGPAEFKIVIPDPVAQQVGGMLMIQSDGKPTQVGFRLKVVNGKIVEAEHMLAEPTGASLDNLKKVRAAISMEIPYEYRDSRGRLIHIAKSYYDALDLNNGSLAPFAPDCERRENGMRTAPFGGPTLGGAGIPGMPEPPPSLVGMQDCKGQLDSQTFAYIDTIDNRRVEVADEVTGLAMGFSHFHHDMKEKEYPVLNDPQRTTTSMQFDPFDLPALHIYKIWGGQIHEIEAMGFMAPYNAPTGWE
jgi:hypothetical protein